MYSKNKTEIVYDMMKLRYKYNHRHAYYKVKATLAKFSKYFCLPEEEYEAKKDKATLEEDQAPPKNEFWGLAAHVYKKKWMKQTEIAEFLGIAQQTISKKLKEFPKN